MIDLFATVRFSSHLSEIMKELNLQHSHEIRSIKFTSATVRIYSYTRTAVRI